MLWVLTPPTSGFPQWIIPSLSVSLLSLAGSSPSTFTQVSTIEQTVIKHLHKRYLTLSLDPAPYLPSPSQPSFSMVWMLPVSMCLLPSHSLVSRSLTSSLTSLATLLASGSLVTLLLPNTWMSLVLLAAFDVVDYFFMRNALPCLCKASHSCAFPSQSLLRPPFLYPSPSVFGFLRLLLQVLFSFPDLPQSLASMNVSLC